MRKKTDKNDMPDCPGKKGNDFMKEWTLEAKLSNIPVAISVIDEWLEELACPIKAQTQIDVAVDEIFSNIAHYAYAPGSGDATIRLDYDELLRTVSITFSDRGIPFNPLEKEEPDIFLPAEEREIGGLGIFLVRKTMDEVKYRREDDRNILTIVKRIQKETNMK